MHTLGLKGIGEAAAVGERRFSVVDLLVLVFFIIVLIFVSFLVIVLIFFFISLFILFVRVPRLVREIVFFKCRRVLWIRESMSVGGLLLVCILLQFIIVGVIKELQFLFNCGSIQMSRMFVDQLEEMLNSMIRTDGLSSP